MAALRPRSPCWPTAPGGSASGSSTGSRTARNATRSPSATSTPDPAPVDGGVSRPAVPCAEGRVAGSRPPGTYVAQSVVVRYQTRDGASGVDVVDPLVTDPAALLVDRGWLRTEEPRRPPPTSRPAGGEVTVVGWVAPTRPATRPIDGRRARSPAGDRAPCRPRGARRLPRPGLGEPRAGRALVHRAARPVNGPHFFYGLQWWFFAGWRVRLRLPGLGRARRQAGADSASGPAWRVTGSSGARGRHPGRRAATGSPCHRDVPSPPPAPRAALWSSSGPPRG